MEQLGFGMFSAAWDVSAEQTGFVLARAGFRGSSFPRSILVGGEDNLGGVCPSFSLMACGMAGTGDAGAAWLRHKWQMSSRDYSSGIQS